MRSIRRTLSMALGIETGTHVSAGYGHRGKIMRLSDEGARVFPFRWAVILTEPMYSAQRRWQVVVPLYRGARKPLPNDLAIATGGDSRPPWLAAIDPSATGAILSCALVCSVSHLDGHVDRICPATVDDGTLAALEAELRARFALV